LNVDRILAVVVGGGHAGMLAVQALHPLPAGELHKTPARLCCQAPVLTEAAGLGTVVEVVEGTEVAGLLGASERLTGARVRSRGADQPEREMPADLVVDASGRGSRAPRWFEVLGLSAPSEETVDTKLAYATRMYRFAEEPSSGAFIQSEPRLRRGGALLPVEGGRWILTLIGFTGIRPPTDEDMFLDYAAALAHPLP
jgi:hypothetical protein